MFGIAGVSHGDIKPSNFVIDRNDDDERINCELIDFGSCIVRGQDRLPTLNPRGMRRNSTGYPSM